MTIGEAFKRLFSGMTLTVDGKTFPVQTHYGDHKELVKWIQEKDKLGNVAKYPLIWYVIAPYSEFNDQKDVKSRLVILMSTEIFWDNSQRAVKTYDQFIEPLWKQMQSRLKHPHITVWGQGFEKYDIKDEPNYGLDTDDVRLSQNDFSRKTIKGEQSISLDIVDGRVIAFSMRIKTNCII